MADGHETWALTAGALHADRVLSSIAESFSFILDVTPRNPLEAWASFARRRYSREPRFLYAPLEASPEELRLQLTQLDLDAVGPTPIAWMMREQVTVLREELDMLENRNTPRFLEGSLRLYGSVDADLLEQAENLLAALRDWRASEHRPTPTINAREFANLARMHLESCQWKAHETEGWCQLRSDVDGLMVSHGTLLIGKQLKLSDARARALLAHEVGTHMITHINAQKQPLRLLACGLARYDELQEGLAVVAEFLAGGMTPGRMRLLAARVVAVQRLLEGSSFVEIFHDLLERSGMSPHLCFKTTMRVCRSGGLTKDIVYLRGLNALLLYFANGGPLEPLLIGKVGLHHLGAVRSLLDRGVFRQPALWPWFFVEDGFADRNRALRRGLTLLELVERAAT